MTFNNFLRLSELNGKINQTINDAFYSVSYWVIADVTNHSFKKEKNYHNFDLVEKDPDANHIIARIGGKAWGQGAMKILAFEKMTGQKFTNNIHVLLNVSIHFHAVYGLQVSLNDIDPNFTLGTLEQQRLATLEKLVAENASFISRIGDKYFTRNKQSKFGRVIQNVAVISSSTSAGCEDFKHTLLNNVYGYQFSVDEYFTMVQGENNARSFLDKLIEVYTSQKKYDAVVITRGGGAQTDFLIFDNYLIGRAVAKFPIPIITGIGHHKNETIVDVMAHTHTKTPTMAAEFIVAHNKSFEDLLNLIQKNMVIKSQQILSARFRSLSRINNSIVNHTRDLIHQEKDMLVQIHQGTIHASKSILFNYKKALINRTAQMRYQPKNLLIRKGQDIHNVIENFKSFYAIFIREQKGQLQHYSTLIKLMSAENILKKGFAIVKSNHKITSTAHDIILGQEIEVILSKTIIKSTVIEKSDYHGEEFDL